MTQLRILRTFHWKTVFPNPPIYGPGGKGHEVLHHHDKLQYLDGDTWTDVPIVEEPKPDSPSAIRAQKRADEVREAIDRLDIEGNLRDR